MTEDMLQPRRPRRTNGLAFFMGFLRQPELVGSVIPSSRFLERRVIDVADIASARTVVELGPGTGGTTRAILEALPARGRLMTMEIDPAFVALLRRDPDPRLVVHHGSAADIGVALDHRQLSAPEVVISGIPFSTMPRELGRTIIRAVWSSLAPGGRFVAYQFRGHVARLERELLGRPDTEVELLNVPPMRVYRWRKPAESS